MTLEIAIPVLLILLGFVALYYGADWLVRGASGIAAILNIPDAIVGLTLVAFGTSAPEFFVNMVAAINGNTEFALANVAGSNLTNNCVGYGSCALVGVLLFKWEAFRTDFLFYAFAPILIVGLALVGSGTVPFWQCSFLFLGLAVYMYSMRSRLKNRPRDADRDGIPDDIDDNKPEGSLLKHGAVFLVGVLLLYGGGEAIFRSSVSLGRTLGFSEALLGLTVVAMGTSLPDVMASVVATRRGMHGIAVGNILGSNIFNSLLVLGGTMLFSLDSLSMSPALMMDFGVNVGISLLVLTMAKAKGRLPRAVGIAMLAVFFVYMSIRVATAIAHGM